MKEKDTILKEIELGKYKDCYLAYNRKSTDEPENQKNSIKYQKSENIRFAFREHLKIANLTIEGFCVDGVVSEKHSAFKENTEMIIGDNGVIQYKIERPKFFKMIQFLNNGRFKGVIILCWDRISRNKGDETVIRKLMKQGIDFQFVLATYDKTSSGALHMDIDGMFAEHHSRVTSEKVKLNIRNLKDKGICTYKAPVGYLNSGSMDYKPIDPERAPIIIQIFEKYATGEWSIDALAKWAKDTGFTMPLRRRKRTFTEMQMEDTDDVQTEIKPTNHFAKVNSIQKILTNPFYIGKLLNNSGELIMSKSHQPIISEELFKKVQTQLARKNVSVKYVNKIEYPFRGIARCHYCNKSYTPYLQKGILYLGHRTSSCTNSVKNINADKLFHQIIDFLSQIVMTEKDVERLNAEAENQLGVLLHESSVESENASRRKNKLKDDLEYLLDNKLSLLKNNVYSPESIHLEEQKLKNQIFDIELNELIKDFNYKEAIDNVIKLSELLKNLIPLAQNATFSEKDSISRLVMSELFIQDNTLLFKCRNGFEALEKHFVSLGALNSWLSELPSLTKDIRYGIATLSTHIPDKYRPP